MKDNLYDFEKEKSRIDRRREFRENLDAREYVRENKAVGDNGGIQVPQFVKSRKNNSYEQAYENREKIHKKYKNSGKKIKGVKKSKRKYKGKALAMWGLSALLTIGGITGAKSYVDYRKNNAPITLEQALENGETAESLQINEDTLKEIQALQKQLEEKDIDVNDLQNIGNDIYDLQRGIIKSKVASQMNVKPEDITLKSYYEASDDSEIESIKIAGEYKSEPILILEDKLPKEVENYISSIVNTQIQMGKVENGEFNKGKIIKEYKEALEESSEFAAGDLKIETKKGDAILNTKKVTKMTYTQTKQKDLQEKESQEQEEER